MSNVEFGWIGWCKDGASDKVWCYFQVSDSWYAGWGRRGKKLNFKNHGSGEHARRALETLARKKEAGKWDRTNQKYTGYKEVDSFMLFTVFPYFEDTVNKELFVKALSGKVK